MRPSSNTPVRLSEYRPSDFLIDAVYLDIRLDRTASKIFARLSIRRNPNSSSNTALILDGDELALLEAKLNGKLLDQEEYLATPDSFTLLHTPENPFTIEITTEINPTANTQLSGLYRSGSAFCTQCEAEGFRRITYFLDRPDVLAIYTTRIQADKYDAPVLLSNGNLKESGEIVEGNQHYAIWHDPFPKPSYLFAVVGGDLGVLRDNFETMSGRKIDLAIYVEHGKEARADYAMDALKRSMRWDEQKFGREYDLDVFNIVAVSDFNMGAMENKGLNIFNDKYVLASPETATDHDYSGIEAVIAHEYFHNWTGNRITCRDWFQLCLKEGLTVFRDQEFSADQRSRAVERISDVRGLRLIQFPEDSGPLAHPVRPEIYHEINNFYTATVYEKGAEIIRMLRTLIGEKVFREGMDLYFNKYDGTAATIEDFLSCFAKSANRDLTDFSRWYHQAGTPILSIKNEYNSTQKTLTLTLEQHTPPTPHEKEKKPFVIPIILALISETGDKYSLTSSQMTPTETNNGVIEFCETKRTLKFENLSSKPTLSILRGFSAPVKLTTEQTEEDLERLLLHDDDPFNRWQAAQDLALRAIISRIKSINDKANPHKARKLVNAFRALISEGLTDPAFIAQTLSLPSELDLAREIEKEVDPDIIHLSRRSLKEEVSLPLIGEMEELYNRLEDPRPYQPDAAGAGRRALRATLLDLIAAGNKDKGETLAERQFVEANNMTDRLSALSALAAIGRPSREKALTNFYEQFSDDHLVIDKWFALQAMIPEPATIQRVIQLMQHADFSMKNPNRLRSLIGTFTNMNLTSFHALDGSGYALLKRVVLEVDPLNPQIAARLLSSLRSWRTFEPRRRALIESLLREVLGQDKISADLKDIATRALG
ncbi:MAG: aminopeptidase N [Methylocystis sp.]